MENDYSKEALFRFLDHLVDKSLVNAETGKAWRGVATKVLEDLAPAEEADVRKIDIDLTMRRFANRHGTMYKPKSLSVYRSRLNSILTEFSAYKGDPVNYKSPKPNSRTSKSTQKSSRATIEKNTQDKGDSKTEAATPREPNPMSAGLALDYPIRTDFLAQVVVPRDMTLIEAKRLAAFLETLALDFTPDKRT